MVLTPRFVAAFAFLLGVLLLVFVLATRYVAAPWLIAGDSMSPSLAPGDGVLLDVWSYRHRAPTPGEIVLAEVAEGGWLVKRVAARPEGDGIWLLGDNPAVSRDSRHFGPVERGRIRGRVAWRYWPPSRFGAVR